MSHQYIEVLFFFFQAEDGIRDLTVTGVQTCALPISAVYDDLPLRCSRNRVQGVRPRLDPHPRDLAGERDADARGFVRAQPPRLIERRSEERRVGKECRSRWSPYH